MKICSTCGQTKNFDSFYKHPASKDGVGTRCKSCYKESNKVRNQENPKPYIPVDKSKKYIRAEIEKKYRKEYLRKYSKEYYKKNREKLIENSKRNYKIRKELLG